jgi:hypothetical protein
VCPYIKTFFLHSEHVHRNEKSLAELENMRHANNNLEIGSVLSKRNKLKNAMFTTLMLDNYEDQLQQQQKSKSKHTFRLLSVFNFLINAHSK